MNNSTASYDSGHPSSGIVLSAFTVTVCVSTLAAFIGNFLVIITFFKTPNLRTSTNYFIVNMAISDLLLALINWPLYMSSCRGVLTGNFAEFVCKFGLYSKIVSLAVSIESLVLIAVDRFTATVYPMKKTMLKGRKRTTLLILSWLIPLTYASPYFYYSKILVMDEQYICLPRMGKLASAIYGVGAFIIHYLAPLIVNIILYSLVLRTVRKPKPGNGHQAREGTRRRKQNQNVLRVVISIVSFFFICWTPLYVYNFVYMFHRKLFSKRMLEVLNCLIYFIFPFLSTVVNPVILFAFSINFRNALKKLVHCACCI